MSSVISTELITSRIYTIRGVQVMLDADLAEMYQVETKVLNQAVKRNSLRFPEDFMFQLTTEEFALLRSQFVTSSLHGGRRYMPLAFTEQGIAMLSGILNSEIAINVNIGIMRAFVNIRRMLLENADLRLAVQALEYRTGKNEESLQMVINTIQQMLNPPVTEKSQKMGFTPKESPWKH